MGCISLAYAAETRNMPRLVLKDADGTVLYSCPMRNGASFAIQYTHSVAQTPVTDYFKIKNNEIWLERTIYQDFGAGLPHEPNKGQTLTRKHGQLILDGYNQRLSQFTLRIGRVAGHKLLIFRPSASTDEELVEVAIPLNELAPPGSGITFQVEQPKTR